MAYRFVPRKGAAGFQVGNTCALAATAVLASLEVFEQTSITEIRKKSIALTGYLEKLLNYESEPGVKNPYWIITPQNPEERGAQLNVQLEPGLLDVVMEGLQANGVVVDERKPDVIRVAPAPLYNSFEDVWEFVTIFKEVCKAAKAK
jgi:kynureninase